MKISSDMLDAMRPDPVTMDPTWSHDTVSRILDSNRSTRAPRERRRRVVFVGLAVAVTSTAGVSAAAAAGLLNQQAFFDVFSYWQTQPVEGHQGVDPATAKRVATAPGPQGTIFAVLSTGHGQQYACRTSILESKESAALPAPSTFTDVTSNFCSTPTARPFGGTDVSFQDLSAGFIVSAGNAVRAEVRTEDGHEYPALLVDGDFWGWFPRSAHPTLVGYASDGSVVGKVRLW